MLILRRHARCKIGFNGDINCEDGAYTENYTNIPLISSRNVFQQTVNKVCKFPNEITYFSVGEIGRKY
jgi:hypothetical protein